MTPIPPPIPARKQPKALETLDRAVAALRADPGLLALHWVGTVPFLLGFLAFAADMAAAPRAWERLPRASLILAVLFVAMKAAHARFSLSIRARQADRPLPRLSPGRLLSMAARQAAIQATALFVLPVMLVLAAPFPWFYAFYVNAGVLDEEGEGAGGIRSLAGASWQQACLWPFHNHALLTVLFVFGLFVVLNLAALVYSLPALARMFFGVQSPALSAALSPLKADFWFVVLALSYLAVDPLARAAYAIRCFHGLSRRTGEDLLARTRRAFGVPALVLAACLAGALAAPVAHAAPPAAGEPAGYARDLGRSVREVLNQPRFSWRLPPALEKAPEKPPGWLAGAVKWAFERLKAAGKKLAQWVEKLWKWLKKLFPNKKRPPPAEDPAAAWEGWAWVLAGAVIVLAAVLALRHARRARPGVEPAGEADPISLVDIRDESVTAQDLPSDRWRELALALLSQGLDAEALRALYLGTVAGLGERELVLPARYKSNRDYLRELSRRAAGLPDVVSGFAFQTEVFERAWYGGHGPTRPEVERFLDLHQRMAGHGA